MGLSRSKADIRGSIKHDGREFVNLSVCAKRLGIAPSSLYEATKKGKFVRIKIEGHKGEWFDWQTTRATFVRLQKHPKKGGSRERKDAQIMNAVPKVAEVQRPAMPTEGANDVEMPDLPKGMEDILTYFDPEDPDNADCWEVDDVGSFMMIPGTDRHYVDWKKAIDKAMANIRYQQYMEKKGDLIPKSEVNQMLSRIFPPITAVIMQMPDKYASRINGRVEEMIGRPMTNEETTIIKSILVDEAERICGNLQDAVQQTTEEQ